MRKGSDYLRVTEAVLRGIEVQRELLDSVRAMGRREDPLAQIVLVSRLSPLRLLESATKYKK